MGDDSARNPDGSPYVSGASGVGSNKPVPSEFEEMLADLWQRHNTIEEGELELVRTAHAAELAQARAETTPEEILRAKGLQEQARSEGRQQMAAEALGRAQKLRASVDRVTYRKWLAAAAEKREGGE